MRLNIGSGLDIHPGWVNIDRTDYPDLDHQCDVLDGLPFGDGEADYAVAHHVLQMVAWPDLLRWLREARRVVRRGGVLRLSVPDVLGAFAALCRGDRTWFPIDRSYEPHIDGAFCMYVTQAGATRSIFTVTHLIDLCERAGWRTAMQTGFGVTRSEFDHITDLDSRPHESLFVEAW